jgi:uncharacterized protein
MTFEVRRAADHLRRPWRNGGGVTAEVASWPPDADAGAEFDWRVSFAEVAGSGDFSLFPGVDRVITLLDGPPMTLHFPRTTEVLEPFRPLAFDGSLRVSCTVEGPTRDLNVMTRRGCATATVDVVEPGTGPVSLAAAEPLLVVALAGELEARDDSARSAVVRTGDVLVTDRAAVVEGAGRLAVVRIGRL